MPLIPGLDFVSGGLAVAYRASLDRQDVTIDVSVSGPPVAPFAHMAMRAVVDSINAGAAGGVVFPPTAGFAARVAGPWDDADALGTSYRWVIEMAGVAPLFVRNIVEELRRAGMNRDVTSMRIHGALPLDASPLSVREAQVHAWLDDPRAYLEAWPAPGFPVQFVPREEGAALRIELVGPLSPPIRQVLEDLAVTWLNVIRNYVSQLGGLVAFDPHKTLPSFGQSKTELRALYGEFLYEREPARAALINLLARFHERVARIATVEISL